MFQYSKYHTLSEVDEAGYRNCSTASAVLSSSDGNTTVALTAPGDRYFVCGNELHCLGGMRLHVPVSSRPHRAGRRDAGEPGRRRRPLPGAAGDAGVPTLDLGGSHRVTVGPAVATWLCIIAAALFVW